jgi:hypothetical protein
LESARKSSEGIIERARLLHNRHSEKRATAKLMELERAIARKETMLRTLHAIAWGDCAMDSVPITPCFDDDERRAPSTLP